VTWIQPEDLVGHELRQAREEGKDVDAVEERWLAGGGRPAPGRGASQESSPPHVLRLAHELLDELDALPSPLAGDEPDEVLVAPLPAGEPDLGRISGAWLGRAAGCVLGKPVESISREGIRAIAEGTGNWPVRSWFTAAGLDPAVTGQRAELLLDLAEFRGREDEVTCCVQLHDLGPGVRYVMLEGLGELR